MPIYLYFKSLKCFRNIGDTFLIRPCLREKEMCLYNSNKLNFQSRCYVTLLFPFLLIWLFILKFPFAYCDGGICGGQRIVLRSWLFPSVMWFLVIELRSLGLVAIAFLATEPSCCLLVWFLDAGLIPQSFLYWDWLTVWQILLQDETPPANAAICFQQENATFVTLRKLLARELKLALRLALERRKRWKNIRSC